MRLLFESGTVDRRMTGLAAIHPCDRLVESIAVELVQYDLADIRYLVEDYGILNDRGVLDRRQPFVPLGGFFGQLVLQLLDAWSGLLDFFLDSVLFLPRFFNRRP